MAREILFKAKRIDNGEWVEGYYIYHIKRTPCVFNDCVKPEDEQHVIMCDGFSDWNMPRDTVHYDIDINTLCQYTGLTDKNGNKIFDGDILVLVKGATHPIKVYWDGLGWKFLRNGKKIEDAFECNTIGHIRVCEVIGNIFDHKELLGGADNG